MITYSKVTEIFCIVDEFCKEFDKHTKPFLIGRPSKRPRIMSQSEVITIMILFHMSGFKCFKHFYIHYVKVHMYKECPNSLSYNRFTELQQKSILPLTMFLKLFRKGDCTGISFVDFTCIRVCKNKRIKQNKVFKEIAKVGKSTMGWFYGFKLHLIINDKGEILGFTITPANVDDRTPLKQEGFIKAIFGKLFVVSDKILLRKRSIIETVNDELKNMCQVEHSRHRSVGNFFTNLIAGLIAYSFFPKKPSIKYRKMNTNQLAIF